MSSTSTFRKAYDAGAIFDIPREDTTVAYAYGNTREDIYCLPCATRKNGLHRARPITLNDIANNFPSGDFIECAFCGAEI